MKTKVQAPGVTTHTAQGALLIYGDSGNPTYATLHAVHDGKIVPATQPLTQAGLRAALSPLLGKPQKPVIWPANMLYFSAADDLAVWWRASAPSLQSFGCEELGNRRAVINMPSLVFKKSEESLSVCAVKGTDRPNASTQVYHSGIFNINDTGKVCLGDVKLPSITEVTDIGNIEKDVLEAINTHINGYAEKTRYEFGLYALWKHLLDHPDTPWNDEWLAPMKSAHSDKITTLSQWMQL